MESAILTVKERPASKVGLGEALAAYISKYYERSSVPFASDCATVDSMRSKALQDPPESALAYVGQILPLTAKFPGDVCDFEWKSTLGYTTGTVSSPLLLFDALNFQYNVGAWYSKQAQLAQDYRVAFQSSQNAAGAFCDAIKIAEQVTAPLPRDLDLATLKTLKLLSLAQAQEFVWAKQRDEGKIGHLLLAKLAAAATQEYKRCASAAAKSTAIKAEWIDHINGKIILFGAIVEFRTASYCLEQSKYGEQVARLGAASKILAEPPGKYIGPQLSMQLESLKDRVASDLNNATKENDLIYMQAVPTRLAPIQPKLLAEAQPPVCKTAPKSLFTLLLPFAVYQTPAAYQQRLTSYVQTFIIDEIESMSNQTAQTFANLGLPTALEVATDSPATLPNSLLRESDAIVEAGGIDAAQSYLNDNMNLAKTAKLRLDALPPSDEAAALQKHLETATRSDELLQHNIEKYRYLVEVLAGGHSAIETFLPAASDTNQSAPEPAELRIKAQQTKAIVARLESLQTRWKNQVGQYQLRFKTIDFSTPINKFIEQSSVPITDPSQLEPVYNEVVSEFDNDLKELDHVKEQHSHFLSTLKERFAMFSAVKAPLERQADARQQQIQVLQVASHEYWNIKANLKEGRKFYNALIEKITGLEAPVGGEWTPDVPIAFG